MSLTDVVVWEVLNSAYNAWRAFEPAECKEIEKAYQKYRKNGSQNDFSFKTGHNCYISFKDMEETYQTTG